MQKQMFVTEDLPLFSGTPMKVKVEPYAPVPAPPLRQAILGNCRTCQDTGQVDSNFCWCEAGEALKIFKRKEIQNEIVRYEQGRPVFENDCLSP